jgi:hypothetical protein
MTQTPNYEIFGSKNCGYTCFILYKSYDKNMYIIITDAHSDKIANHYVKIEDETIFGNYTIAHYK